LNSKLTLYDALVSINVPGDQARAVVEALEHEMYTALATKADLAHQAQLFSERLERLRLEIRADRLEDIATLRAEIAAGDGSLGEAIRAGDRSLRDEMRAMRDELRAEIQAGDAALRDEMRAMRDELRAEMQASDAALRTEMRAADAALRAEMQAGFRKLEASDAAIRVEIAQLATTLTQRMGVGLAAVAGLVISAQQFL
jgi:predicted  nucleic acid-binding Zn-ribbon protein